jgi:hypothetical protein
LGWLKESKIDRNGPKNVPKASTLKITEGKKLNIIKTQKYLKIYKKTLVYIFS